MPLIEWATRTPEPVATLAPETGEIADSWEEIIAHIDDGTARQRYAIGAYKPLDLDTLGTVNMQLAGFDLDDRADGTGKAPTAWIAKECLPEGHQWNPWGKGTDGGWAACELRQYLKETVFPAIPASLGNRLVNVKKEQYVILEKQATEDTLWIPDFYELFRKESLYYGLFENTSEKRIKTKSGSASVWWLRSAYVSSTVYAVSSDGSINGGNNVDLAHGVVVGFCL